jgi:hypothetical protein
MKQGSTCAVIGLARAGVPAARFLIQHGARVIGYDNRELAELGPEAQSLHELGVDLRTGDHHFAGLDDCDCIVLSPGLKIHHEPLRSILAAREANEVVELRWRNREAGRQFGDARIARGSVEGESRIVLLESPRQGVLAAAAPDNQNLHLFDFQALLNASRARVNASPNCWKVSRVLAP